MSIVWEKYAARRNIDDATRLFVAELIHGAYFAGQKAGAAMVDEAAAECRTKGKRLDSYDLGTLAARMREGGDTL